MNKHLYFLTLSFGLTSTLQAAVPPSVITNLNNLQNQYKRYNAQPDKIASSPIAGSYANAIIHALATYPEQKNVFQKYLNDLSPSTQQIVLAQAQAQAQQVALQTIMTNLRQLQDNYEDLQAAPQQYYHADYLAARSALINAINSAIQAFPALKNEFEQYRP